MGLLKQPGFIYFNETINVTVQTYDWDLKNIFELGTYRINITSYFRDKFFAWE